MIRPSEARHIHHKDPIDGPAIGIFSAKQGV